MTRIGTWNLAGRWTDDHRAFLLGLECDVLLLTEVSERLELAGHHLHLSVQLMAARRRWAAVLSRTELTPLRDPHPASAMAIVEGTTYCSSILPWKGAPSTPPWVGPRHVDKTEHSVKALVARLPARDLVWGGDWNHALEGREYAGSKGGRQHVLRALDGLGLKVPTTPLPHRIGGLLTIDHIAVARAATVVSATRYVAEADGKRLSDHDAYVVETDR
ncbi:MAG: endonuclease/exonuclease/phosphatase family protein [Nocardioides sp.]